MGLMITIVRHGNSFEAGEPARRIGARTDLPLTEAGRAQAQALHDRFAADGIRFHYALVSPIRRTMETARLILAGDTTAVERVGWLEEIDHGPDEGMTEDAVLARIGAAAIAAWESDGIPPPGWHVDSETRIAAWRALFDDSRAGSDAHILIVTSNGAARFALAADAALDRQARALPSRKLRTGAWGRIAVEDGHPRLIAWDCRP
jgi:probable phosphoglycerate mutase